LVERHRLAGLTKDLHQFIHATDTSIVRVRRIIGSRGHKARISPRRTPRTTVNHGAEKHYGASRGACSNTARSAFIASP
jgi:hypothetical protein